MIQDEGSVAAELAHESVEQTFRLIMRRAIIMAFLTSLTQSFLFWFLGEPIWRWTLGLAGSSVVFYFMATPNTNYSAFILATIGQFASVVVYATVLTASYGRDLGFHFTLFSVVPIIMVGVRIGTFSKFIISAALLAFTLWLDSAYPVSHQALLEYTSAVAVMRGVNIAIIFLVGGSLVHYFYMMSWDARQRLLLTANFDPLTHLVNRRRLQDVADLSIAQFARHQRPLSVVLCDIDHFKSINDRFGHHAGDDVLVGVAKVLMDCARTTDSVSRWGGEEFLVLLTDTDIQGAQTIAERIRRSIAADPLRSEQLEIKITMTLGVAQYADGESLSTLVARADAALYQGKTGGRNQVVLAASPQAAEKTTDQVQGNPSP